MTMSQEGMKEKRICIKNKNLITRKGQMQNKGRYAIKL